MSDRAELLEATLNGLPEGAALLDENGHLVFWNQAAHAITGYAAVDVVGRPTAEALKPLLSDSVAESGSHAESGRGFAVYAQHKLGHEISAMARLLTLRDGLGGRIGTAVLFHPAECLDALPHGVTSESEDLESSLDDLKERLETLFEDFTQGGLPFAVLWITVDQAHELRKTHGMGACEAMLKRVEHALAQGLRPAEHLGRWGEDEFLVICHERTPELLAKHAATLGGLVRTADFRWWGDRVSISVSIGAAQAESTATLADMLERARAAMLSSRHAGGNRVTQAPEGHSCLPL